MSIAILQQCKELLQNGNQKQAADMARTGLVKMEVVFGEENHHTLNVLANLTATIAESPVVDDWKEAEVLGRQALSVRERVLPRHHTDTFLSLLNLARIYHKQGKYQQAEDLFQQALGYPRQEDDPWRLDCMAGLLSTYRHLLVVGWEYSYFRRVGGLTMVWRY